MLETATYRCCPADPICFKSLCCFIVGAIYLLASIHNFSDSNSDTGSSSAAFTPFPASNAADRACDGHPIIDYLRL
ncbi:hypothetical protein WN944_009949 [Citrus x changshan-huyou]|uniref:Uncharacterized protein n=1 Tax=Citrus x changshan-huyou TaxID=2935761 RepID=A0AAP0MW95_9ROSI